jgi:hypothetical protein
MPIQCDVLPAVYGKKIPVLDLKYRILSEFLTFTLKISKTKLITIIEPASGVNRFSKKEDIYYQVLRNSSQSFLKVIHLDIEAWNTLLFEYQHANSRDYKHCKDLLNAPSLDDLVSYRKYLHKELNRVHREHINGEDRLCFKSFFIKKPVVSDQEDVASNFKKVMQKNAYTKVVVDSSKGISFDPLFDYEGNMQLFNHMMDSWFSDEKVILMFRGKNEEFLMKDVFRCWLNVLICGNSSKLKGLTVITGAPSSGKSLLAKIVQSMMGYSYCWSGNLTNVNRFTLGHFLDLRLVCFNDIRRNITQTLEETLRSLTGADRINGEEKFEVAANAKKGVYTGHILIIGNNSPRYEDPTGGLPDRALNFDLSRVPNFKRYGDFGFTGLLNETVKRDGKTYYSGKLGNELPYILGWILSTDTTDYCFDVVSGYKDSEKSKDQEPLKMVDIFIKGHFTYSHKNVVPFGTKNSPYGIAKPDDEEPPIDHVNLQVYPAYLRFLSGRGETNFMTLNSFQELVKQTLKVTDIGVPPGMPRPKVVRSSSNHFSLRHCEMTITGKEWDALSGEV